MSDLPEPAVPAELKAHSATAGKGKVPAKTPRLSIPNTRDNNPNYNPDPLEGSTSNLQLQ
ncbi:Hypothetical predicted protein, partial [Pelobates cultripes]